MVKLGVTIQVSPKSNEKAMGKRWDFLANRKKTVIFHSYITLLEGMAKTELLYYITFDQ